MIDFTVPEGTRAVNKQEALAELRGIVTTLRPLLHPDRVKDIDAGRNIDVADLSRGIHRLADRVRYLAMQASGSR